MLAVQARFSRLAQAYRCVRAVKVRWLQVEDSSLQPGTVHICKQRLVGFFLKVWGLDLLDPAQTGRSGFGLRIELEPAEFRAHGLFLQFGRPPDK